MDGLHLDDLKIDSLVDLLKATYTLEDWDKMIEIADILYFSAQEFEGQIKTKRKSYERHLVYYFGYSQLMKGIALQNKGLYKEAKDLIEKYSDLSWLDDGSKEASEEINFFKMFAKANIYAVNLLEGNLEYLAPYVKFLRESRVDELMPGLFNIVEADIRHNLNINIDVIINSFSDDIIKAIEYYKQRNSLYSIKFFFNLSLYYIKKKRYSIAIDNTIRAIELSNTLKDAVGLKNCINLFEAFRGLANEDQEQRYVILKNNLQLG